MHSRQELADCAETLIILRLYRIEEVVEEIVRIPLIVRPCFNRDFLLDSSRQFFVDLVFNIDSTIVKVLFWGREDNKRVSISKCYQKAVEWRRIPVILTGFIFWEDRRNNRLIDQTYRLRRCSNVYFFSVSFSFPLQRKSFWNVSDDYIKNSFFSQLLFFVQLHF